MIKPENTEAPELEEPHGDESQVARSALGWASIHFLEAPSSRVLKWALAGVFTTVVCAAVAAFVVELDVTVPGRGQVISDLGTREIITRAAGYLTSFTKSVGDSVQENEVVGTIAMDRTNATEVRALERALLSKIESLKAAPNQQPPEGEPLNLLLDKISNQDVVASLIEVDRARMDFEGKSRFISRDLERETAPLKARRKKLEADLRRLKTSRNRKLLAFQIETFQNEADDLKVKIETAQNAARTRAEDSRQNLIRSLNTAASKLHLFVELFEIKAPVEGQVGQVLAETNKYTGAEKALALVVPASSKRVAEVRISTRYLGQVRKGQPVSFKMEAFPYLKYGVFEGEVQTVELPRVDAAEGTPYFIARATVALPAQGRAIASEGVKVDIGMSFEAAFIVKRKKIYRLILDKILGEP